VIVYADTSVLVRAFLPDEEGHAEAVHLLADEELAVITGSWTRIELASALTRAAAHGRAQPDALLDAALEILGDDGPVAVIAAPQVDVERIAFELVRAHGIRAMDAWHLACATITVPQLAEPGEARAFATRDTEQASAARELGLTTM
jgi:predicted nucleic acid-binding protein